MIIINLLPKEKRKRRKESRTEIIIKVIIGAIVTLYLLVIISFWQIMKEKKEISQQIGILQKEISKYKGITNEKQKIRKKILETKKRIEIIAFLLDKNTRPIKIIDLITKNIPKKEIFLEKLSYDSISPESDKYVIYIQGNSVKLESIAKYIQSLEKSQEFKSIILEGIKDKKTNDYKFTNFRIRIEI